MIVGIIILSVFARVFYLKSTPYNSWVMRVFIVWVKNLVKQSTTFCQTKSFAGPLRVGLTCDGKAKHNFLPNEKFRVSFVSWPYLRDSCENSNLARLFIFQSYALHVAYFAGCFLWDNREPFAKFTCSTFETWFFTDLSHSSLSIKATYIQGKWLKKLQ